jgi:hypothetical protein
MLLLRRLSNAVDTLIRDRGKYLVRKYVVQKYLVQKYRVPNYCGDRSEEFNGKFSVRRLYKQADYFRVVGHLGVCELTLRQGAMDKVDGCRLLQNKRGWRRGSSRPKYSYARAVATRPRGVRSIIPICIR